MSLSSPPANQCGNVSIHIDSSNSGHSSLKARPRRRHEAAINMLAVTGCPLLYPFVPTQDNPSCDRLGSNRLGDKAATQSAIVSRLSSPICPVPLVLPVVPYAPFPLILPTNPPPSAWVGSSDHRGIHSGPLRSGQKLLAGIVRPSL